MVKSLKQVNGAVVPPSHANDKNMKAVETWGLDMLCYVNNVKKNNMP